MISSNINKTKLIYLLVALAAALPVSRAEVDTSRPDLSVFKLRRVDTRRLALERAHRPIVDLAKGAEHMRESLYSSSRQVRCPAYAHLFRLIKRAQGGGPSDVSIQQTTVEALAVAVTNERQLYFDLLTRQPSYLLEASRNFMEAVEALERSQLADADAFLELVGCLRDVVGPHSPEVRQFLDQPQRAKRLAQVAQFKSIPAGDGAGAPQGMVNGLIGRFELRKPAKLSAQDFHQAQELIESLDDELVATFRRQQSASSDPKNGGVEELQQEGDDGGRQGGQGQQAQISGGRPPSPLELVVPIEGDNPTSGSASFDGSRLAILMFIKMRLEQRPSSRWHQPARLSMRLAFDYQAHWQDLVAYKPAAGTKLGELARAFREDPANLRLAERVERAIGTYEELVAALGAMQDDHLESLDELERPLGQVGELLRQMDSAFDVDDIRRLNEIWRAKLQEYKTMDKFINGDFGW